MNDKENKKSSFFSVKPFGIRDLFYIIFILFTLYFSISNYLYIRREGYINIFVPSRYGTMRGTHHSNTSDKILLCFTLHNNGNIFRNINTINLTLIYENGSKWNLEATGKFDKLKDLDLRKSPLKSNPNYSLITNISLNKNQFVSLNLLFYYKDDTGWTNSGKVFRFKRGVYIGKITVTSLESDDNGYRSIQYESDSFSFTVKYEPFDENIINTFTNINMAEKIK